MDLFAASMTISFTWLQLLIGLLALVGAIILVRCVLILLYGIWVLWRWGK